MLESGYYVFGVVSLVLGWYFNVRYIHQYGHEASYVNYTKSLVLQLGVGLGRPGLHHRQRRALPAVVDHRRTTARVCGSRGSSS